MYDYSDELAHYGILGQKWGVRRYQNEDGTLTAAGKQRYAENYSEQQRTRDRKLYGKGAEKRINKRMLEGESIQSARHNEVVRKERIDKTKNIARNVAKAGVVVAGIVATKKLMENDWGKAAVSSGAFDYAIRAGKSTVDAILR